MNKKKIFIGLGIFILAAVVLIFIFAQGGVTKKGQFSKCMEVCYDLLLMESSKQYCPEQCTTDTGYEPTRAELNEIIADLTNSNTNIKSTNTASTNINTSSTNKSITNTTVNKNTNTVTNLNSNKNTNTNTDLTDYENRSYYCDWTWPQIIIDQDTEEEIVSCNSQRPYCNYADHSFENVGCCTNGTYTDCITLPDLLK